MKLRRYKQGKRCTMKPLFEGKANVGMGRSVIDGEEVSICCAPPDSTESYTLWMSGEEFDRMVKAVTAYRERFGVKHEPM